MIKKGDTYAKNRLFQTAKDTQADIQTIVFQAVIQK